MYYCSFVKESGTHSCDDNIMYLYRSYVEKLHVITVRTPVQNWSYMFHIVAYLCVF